MQLPVNSFDVVFSNWLLMYLDNEEVAKLAADSLRWVSIPTLRAHAAAAAAAAARSLLHCWSAAR
jgi:hypothetical protein